MNDLVKLHELANRPLIPLSRDARRAAIASVRGYDRVRIKAAVGYYGNLEWQLQVSDEPRVWRFTGYIYPDGTVR